MENKRRRKTATINKSKFSQIDKVNFGFSIFNAICVIVTLFVSIWSINKQEEIAEKSGSFDKGEITVRLGSYNISAEKTGQEIDIYYGIDFTDSSLHLVELPISIYNRGRKTLENVNLLIKYPHVATIALADSFVNFSSPTANKVERKFTTGGKYDQVSFFLNSIDPNSSAIPGELIVAREETKGNFFTKAYTKDSVLLGASINYSYHYIIEMLATAKDSENRSFRFNINYLNNTNKDSIIDKIVSYKRDSKQKKKGESWQRNFFVLIPQVTDVMNTIEGKLKVLNLNENNASFGVFSDTKEYIIILDKDFNTNKVIKI